MTPSAPPSPCRNPSCPALTTSGYCDDHAPTTDDNRPSAARRGYDRKWRKVRRAYLNRHPLCEHCMDRGETQAADMVDHIVPLKKDGDRLAYSNLQALCNSCHARKTHGS